MLFKNEENYLKKEDLKEYIKKKDLSEYAKKEDLPDSTIYALKKDIPKLPDLSEYAKRNEIPKPIDLSEYAKKENIPEIPDHSIYILKEDIKKDYLKKEDLPKPQDLSNYAKKSDINNPEYFHCFVKLKENFRIYDGTDWQFEFYMGNRGNWEIVDDTHDSLSKPEEYICYTPFKGIFFIDFCFTCQRDTHLLKPHTLQRIRTSTREIVNFEYYDNSSSVHGSGHDITLRTFRDKCELLLPEKSFIKFSMEFTNRNHNHKKQWLHAKGSDGNFTPTYFSITGIKIP